MIKNFLARVGCLTLIALVVAGGWWFRDDIAGLWNRIGITASSRPSEQLAERASEKIRAFASAGENTELQLSQPEVQSLLTYRAEPLFPPGVSEPLVEIRDSTVLLSARVDAQELEGLASPELVERFLSDSTRVTVELLPGITEPGVAQVEVVTLQAGSLVIPSMMVPWILESLELEGIEARGGALLLPAPVRLERFEVAGGGLRIVTR